MPTLSVIVNKNISMELDLTHLPVLKDALSSVITPNLSDDSQQNSFVNDSSLSFVKTPNETRDSGIVLTGTELPDNNEGSLYLSNSSSLVSLTPREKIIDWTQFPFDKVPQKFQTLGPLPRKYFQRLSLYKPLVLNTPRPDFFKIIQQESHLDEIGHIRLCGNQLLDFTSKSKQSEVKMFACDQNQAFFDKEITLQKQDIANIENNTFKFQNERLKSCYMISHSLGDGSFGFVYEGVRYSDGLNVAIKFIRKPRLALPDILKMKTGPIAREIYYLSKLSHDGIIKFVDYFDELDHFVLVTEKFGTLWYPENPVLNKFTHPGTNDEDKKPEVDNKGDTSDEDVHSDIDSYMSDISFGSESSNSSFISASSSISSNYGLERYQSEGLYVITGDLDSCIALHKSMSNKTVRDIFMQVVEAIQYMHSNGYCHLDIKDANVLIDENYRTKLIDFGACTRFAEEGDIDNYFEIFRGTESSNAPELLVKNDPYRGPEQDVWSLGVLLYKIMYNHFAFYPIQNTIDYANGGHRPYHFASFEDNDFKHLINWMFARLPEDRPTANQILNHPWMKKNLD